MAARADRSWVRKLSATEQAALKESEDFFQRPDGRLQKVLGRVGRPLGALLKASPKRLQRAITGSIHGVLTTVADGAEAGFSERALIDRLCQKVGFELEPWERIFSVDYHLLDEEANSKLRVAKNLAVVQGGLTGLGGAPGLIADIPSLYFLMFRTIHQVALCFGFPANTPVERRYLLQVVNVGHHLELRDRRFALIELEQLEQELSRGDSTTEDLQRALLAKSVQLLAGRLAATLVQRKAVQTFAVVGGAVGAMINRQLLDDVGSTAFHAYRRRYLQKAAEVRP